MKYYHTKTNQLTINVLAIVLCCLLTNCGDDEQVDMDYPVIDLSVANAFPQQCSHVTRGETFTFRARFTDNVQLGGFSLDIHENFDHHSHSTDTDDCDPHDDETPVNPFQLIQDYDIPAGQKEYLAEVDIEVPADVDPGDYHFRILLTDKAGWQTIKGLSVKVD